jgi:hypothetical protein
MPILKPQIDRLLQQSGVGAKKSDSKDIREILDASGLSLQDTLEKLRDLRDFTESEGTKVRISESILKMHGVMKEEGASIPTINIIIADPGAPTINPIILPRELHNSRKESIQ